MTDPEPLPTRPPSWRERVELLTQPPPTSVRSMAIAGAAIVAAVTVGWLLLRPPAGPPTEELLPLAGATSTSSSTTAAPSTLVVHVAGAVSEPGVYEVPADARVMDVIDAAGGPTADADVEQLNLAAPVVDGSRIYVPRFGEIAPAVSGASAAADEGPLDLNAATLEQLDALPGIGPTTAQAILDERERRGGFRSVDELLEVRGIGPAKLEQLRDLVRV